MSRPIGGRLRDRFDFPVKSGKVSADQQGWQPMTLARDIERSEHETSGLIEEAILPTQLGQRPIGLWG